MMTIADLAAILPIEGEVVQAPTEEDWRRFEAEQMALPTDYKAFFQHYGPLAAARIFSAGAPSDYKAFLQHYGSGVIDDFLQVLNPFCSPGYRGWLQDIKNILNADVAVRKHISQLRDWVLFPEPGGILPWGRTGNGDTLYWKTEGTPEEWTIEVHAVRSPDRFFYKENLVDFIYHLLTVPDYCEVFEEFTQEPPIFSAFAFGETVSDYV